MKLRTACLLVGLLGFGLLAADRIVEETFEVNPGADFSLDSHKGKIKITTDNGNTIRMYARIFVEAGEDDRAIEYTKIETRATKNSVRVKVDHNQEALKSMFSDLVGNHVQTPYVNFEIIIPDDLNLNLESHKSEFEIDAPAGEITIESHKGHGYIRGVRNDLDLESHKGEFEVEILKMRDLKIESHKGDINVDIGSAKNFTLRGHTHKGALSVAGRDVRIIKEKRGRDYHMREKFGTGEFRVSLETHKGSIRLNFQD